MEHFLSLRGQIVWFRGKYIEIESGNGNIKYTNQFIDCQET